MSEQPASTRRVRLLLVALLVVLAGMTALSVARYVHIERSLDITVSENILWSASQSEIELNRFILGISEAERDPESINRHKIEERFDILWSRMGLYNAGAMARSVSSDPELRAIIDSLFNDLKAVEALLAQPPTRATFQAVREKLQPHAQPLRRVTTAALATDRAERDSLARTLEEIKSELSVLGGSTLVILLILFFYLLRSESRVRQHLEASVQARAEANAAWQRLDEAIENINEGFVLFDAEGRLVRCNQKYREIYAMSADLLVPGMTFEELIRKGAERGQYREAISNPQGWIEERLRRQRDIREPFEQQLGDGRWLMVSDRRTKDGGIVGIRTDITELKRNLLELEYARISLRAQAERMATLAEESRRANEVLNDAIESIGEGFVLFDAEDQLVLWNSRFSSYFNRIAPLIRKGLSFESFLYEAQKAGHLALEASANAVAQERKLRRASKADHTRLDLLDGQIWLQISDHHADNGGMVTVFNDITELKQREIALLDAQAGLQRQAERMQSLIEVVEAASRSKSDFLAMVSHEIRTPMNAVLGLAHLLDGTTLDAEQRKFVTGIEESGAHLLGLINDILDFSRLEAQKEALDIAPLSLREVVAGATNMVSVLAGAKNLEIRTHLDPGMPDLLEGDATRLSQVLINLLGNAIKFTPSGHVALTTRLSSVVGDRAAFSIRISDTGPGISKELRRRIFHPFERGEVAKTGQISGTGLGLAITHRLVALMGGVIELQESPEGGASFDMRFNFKTSTPELWALASRRELPRHAISVDEKLRPLRILVAEDTPASQLVIKTMLERRGHYVVVTSDGNEALVAAQKDAFDLALLDLQMPGRDGFETTLAMRLLDSSNAAIPIVALSAQAFPADKQRAFEAGFNDHLAKPIRPQDLDQILALVQDGALAQMRPSGRPVTPVRPQDADLTESEASPRPAIATEIEAPTIDMLAELRSVCDPATFLTLLQIALTNIQQEKTRLLGYLRENDLPGIRATAHKLAGILGQYGANTASHIARETEVAPDEAVPALARTLEDKIDRAVQGIELERNLLVKGQATSST